MPFGQDDEVVVASKDDKPVESTFGDEDEPVAAEEPSGDGLGKSEDSNPEIRPKRNFVATDNASTMANSENTVMSGDPENPLKSVWRAINTPLIEGQPPIEDVERVAKSGTALERKTMGVRLGADQFLSGLTSPLGLATVGLSRYPTVGKALAIAFGAPMLKQAAVDIPKAIGDEMGKPVDKRDLTKLYLLWTQEAVNAGMGAGLAASVAEPTAKPGTGTQEQNPDGGARQAEGGSSPAFEGAEADESVSPDVETSAPVSNGAAEANTAEPIAAVPEQAEPVTTPAAAPAENAGEASTDQPAQEAPPTEEAAPIATGADAGTTPLNQLTRILAETNHPDQSLSDRVGFTERVADRWTDAKDAVDRTLGRLRGYSAALVSSYRTLPEFTDFKRSLGEWLGANQKADLEGRNWVKTIRDKVTDPVRREAISNYIQAAGDESVLAQRAALSKGSLKRGYEMALKLTDPERQLADRIGQYWDARLKEAISAGIMDHGLENYVPQIWKRENPVTQKLQADLQMGKLQTNFQFAKKRIFDSYFEGEQAGYEPATKDIGNLVAIHDQAFNRAVSARAFIRQLHEAKASDGRPLVEISGMGKAIEKGDTPDTVLVKPRVVPEEAADYRVIDHPSLRKWKWAHTDEGGKTTLVQGDMLVHPEAYQHLKNALSSSWFQQNKIARAVLRTQAIAKATTFSLSPFHQVQEGVHALGHRVNPLKTVKLDLNDPGQMELVNHGMTVADFDSRQMLEEGLFGGGPLVNKIPKVGPMQQAYTNWLFHEHIPRLKMTMGLDAMERNLDRYKDDLASGKVTRDQIAELTGKQANTAFGGINYKYIGRNPTLQDALRTFLIAPDFLESRARFVGQAIKPNGREQLVALGVIAATQYMAARVLNSVMDGDPHFETPFTVHQGKRSYGLRSVPADLEELITDFRRFGMNRLSPLVGRGLIEMFTGRDYRGVQVDAGQQLKDLLSTYVPMSLRPKDDTRLWQQALNAAGLRNKPMTALMQIRLIAKNKGGEKPAMEMLGDSPYRALKVAIDNNDRDAARDEYRNLLKTRKQDQVARTFKEASTGTFTTNAQGDRDLFAKLSSPERKVYFAARQEQRDAYAKFQRWFGK